MKYLINFENNDNLIDNLYPGTCSGIYYLPPDQFEVISITDQFGQIVKINGISIGKSENRDILIHIGEGFTLDSPDVEREYTLKYKIPPILGKEHVEELKII